jgi:hypothetical protein
MKRLIRVIVKITDNATDDTFPSLYQGTIAWEGYDYELFYWNGASAVQLTDNMRDDHHPCVFNGGTAGWCRGRR